MTASPVSTTVVPAVARSTALARSLAFAVTTLVVSAVAHVAAGGAPPGPEAVVAVLAAGVVAHRSLLARAEQSWARLAGALLVAQAVVHLSCLRPPDTPVALLRTAAAVAPCHGGQVATAVTPVHAGGPTSPAMLAGHLAAAAVLGFVLRRGEAACWSGAWYARAVLARVASLLPAHRPAPWHGWSRPAAPAIAAGPAVPLRSRLIEGSPRHRGPPRLRMV